MASKLEKAREAVSELKKSMASGEDVTKDEIDGLAGSILAVEQAELLKAVNQLPEKIAKAVVVKKDEDEPKEDEKKAEKDEKEEEVKSEDSVLLDLALEEIVRLRKEDAPYPGPEDKEDKEEKKEEKEYPYPEKKARGMKKQEDEDEEEKPEEEKAIKKGTSGAGSVGGGSGAGEAGPTSKLEKPSSTDYSESKETQVNKQEDEEEKPEDEDGKKMPFKTEAEFKDAVKKATDTILKSAGFVPSSTPVQVVATPTVGGTAPTGNVDIQKGWEKLNGQPLGIFFKEINRFRMDVDPSLRNLDQRYFTLGRAK